MCRWPRWHATLHALPPAHAPPITQHPPHLLPPDPPLRYTTIKAVSTAGDEYQYAAGARPSRITEHVVIGTHGRLKHWTSKKMLDLDNIQILVFDEADEMLKEDGFADDSVGKWGRLGGLGAGLLCVVALETMLAAWRARVCVACEPLWHCILQWWHC